MRRNNKESRRNPGDGAIYQRADGRWVAALNLGIVHGKRKRVIRYASSEKEARQKLRTLQRQQEDGVTFNAAKMTVAPVS